MKRESRPLFVPLTKETFNDFMNGKTWELRKAQRQWNERQIFPGREVTLSCGYSGQRKTGLIVDRVIFGTLEEIFHRIPYREIEPRAKTENAALQENEELLGKVPRYVAFRVAIKF